MPTHADKLREITAGALLSTSPLGQAMLVIADHLDDVERRLAALEDRAAGESPR